MILSFQLQQRLADICVVFIFFGVLYELSQMTPQVAWYKRYGAVLIGCASLGILHSHIINEPNARIWFHLCLYGVTMYFGGTFVAGVIRCVKNLWRVYVLKEAPKEDFNERRFEDRRP